MRGNRVHGSAWWPLRPRRPAHSCQTNQVFGGGRPPLVDHSAAPGGEVCGKKDKPAPVGTHSESGRRGAPSRPTRSAPLQPVQGPTVHDRYGRNAHPYHRRRKSAMERQAGAPPRTPLQVMVVPPGSLRKVQISDRSATPHRPRDGESGPRLPGPVRWKEMPPRLRRTKPRSSPRAARLTSAPPARAGGDRRRYAAPTHSVRRGGAPRNGSRIASGGVRDAGTEARSAPRSVPGSSPRGGRRAPGERRCLTFGCRIASDFS
jgi:hypothetical protein